MKGQCPNCGKWWLFDDSDVVYLALYPHYLCPDCGGWIAAF